MALKVAKVLENRDPKFTATFGDASPVSPRTDQPAPLSPPTVREPAIARPSDPAPIPSQLEPTGRVGKKRVGTGERRVMVNVQLRPLAAQEERIEAAGLSMDSTLRAAWRQATASLTLGATYVAPPKAERTEGQGAAFRTTMRVDAAVLDELAREHDFYGITPPWSLIRGQVEGVFWKALDDVLKRLTAKAQARGGAGAGEAKVAPGTDS